MNIQSNRLQASEMANQLAVDPSQLSSLKLAATKDPKAAAREVANQFEALFMNNLMRAMRETHLGGDDDSSDMDTYRGLLDQQMVQQMSHAGGVGLGDMLYRQIAKVSHVDLGDKGKVIQAPGSSSEGSAPMAQSVNALNAYADSMAAASAVHGTQASTPSDSKSFINTMMPHAKSAADQLGVAPEAVLAHAALESGWGKRAIRNQDGSDSHNLFGIKASTDWQGKTVNVLTTEYSNGQPQKRVEKFRAYPSYQAAFDDYAKLLKDSPRYKAALNQGENMQAFAHGLQAGGYATDPRYARKLVGVAASLNQPSVRL